MKNKEIELKFIITPKIKKEIIADLEKVAIKTHESHVIDTYYIPKFKEFEINGITIECVRIRENNRGAMLCYKKIHRDATPIYCDEYETKIDNKEEMEKILLAIDFEIQMVIDKTRVSYEYAEFEFDFDSVKNLGELLEVEFKSDSDSVEPILKWVAKYGLTKNDINYEGIQALMKKYAKNIKK